MLPEFPATVSVANCIAKNAETCCEPSAYYVFHDAGVFLCILPGEHEYFPQKFLKHLMAPGDLFGHFSPEDVSFTGKLG